MNAPFAIAGRPIGPGQPTYFVAELSANHNQDFDAAVALVRAAGGIVSDLAGQRWTISSDSALAAAPGVHQEMLETLDRVGPVTGFR